MTHLKIMVVDDSRTIRDLLTQQLEEFHYTVTAASSGEEAVRALEADIFDVVITDLNMPGAVDGMRLLEIAKQEQEEGNYRWVGGWLHGCAC